MSEQDEDHDGPPTLLPIAGFFTDLGEAKKKKLKWIIRNLISPGLTLIVGPAKDAFKTTIALALGLRISKHETNAIPTDWVADTTGPVLIIEDEGDPGDLRSIAEDGMGVKPRPDESIMVADHPEMFRLDDEEASNQLISWCDERGVAACVLGPLANFHSLDEKDSVSMIKILRPVRRWAIDNDAAFIIHHHTRKIEEGRAYTANDARGTSAIFGLCDNILVITPGKEKFELLIARKGKKGESVERMVMLNIWDRVGNTLQEPLTTLDKMIIDAVRHKYGTAQQIASHHNLIPNQVQGRITSLCNKGILAVSKAGLLYLKAKLSDKELKYGK